MSKWSKATITEQIKASTVEQLSIGDIAKLIAKDDAELEREIISEMTRDYLNPPHILRASGDVLHHLARVLRFGWLDGKWREAGLLLPVTQEQYTDNQNYLEIVQSPFLRDFMVTREAFRNYLIHKPPLPDDCPLKLWVTDDVANNDSKPTKSDEITPNNTKVIEAFKSFNNLRAGKVGWSHNDNGTATVCIGKKKIPVCAEDFGLKTRSVSWGILERAAMRHGEIIHQGKTRTAKADISKLRKTLTTAMNLKGDPIPHTKGAGYKFAFTMTHQLAGGKSPHNYYEDEDNDDLEDNDRYD